MKLTRSEFQNYIHSYEQDEIFYRDLYLAEKEHPETFREYCQNLDREMIAQRKLYVPALRKEGWLPYLNEGTLFQDFTGDIYAFQALPATLMPLPMSMNFLKLCAFMTAR